MLEAEKGLFLAGFGGKSEKSSYLFGHLRIK